MAQQHGPFEYFNSLLGFEPERFVLFVKTRHHRRKIDDTVITGSHDLSRSAEFNAENILFIENTLLVERYSAYIDQLIQIIASLR